MSEAVGVVVPAYKPDIGRLVGYCRELDDALSPATIRVELDDPAGTVADALAERGLPSAVVVAAADRRRGKGAAVTTGFEALSTPILAFADADGATPAASLAEVVDAVRAGHADVAVGSRRHPAADVVGHRTVVRRFLGNGFAWLGRRLLEAELYDYQCGAKALTAAAWRGVRGHLYEPGFAWDIELVAVAAPLGYQIEEVPVRWEDQPGSTVDPVGDSLAMLRGLLAARHRAKLLGEHRMHELIDAGRTQRPALIDRLAGEYDVAAETDE